MLVRCNTHHSPYYIHHAKPIGYPNTAAICGRCDQPGMLFLNETEWEAYQNGKTIFSFNSNVMQVQAEKFSSPR